MKTTDLRTAAQQALELLGTWQKPPARLYRVMDNLRAALAQEQAEPEAWLQPRTVDGYLRPDLGYETCSSVDYGAFPVYRAPPKAEQAQEPVAVVGTQVDVWRGCDGRWAPPGEPIKTALMLKDMPVGTMLYAAPPKRQPLTEEEIKDCFHDARNAKLGASKDNSKHRLSVVEIARAIEQAHGIIEPRIEEDSHQTLDDAMQQPRAMAQAYESGYTAGAAAERKRIIQFLQEMQRVVGDAHNHYGVAAMRIRERV